MIGRRLLRWVAPVVLVLGGWLPASPAQSPADPTSAEKEERAPPALQYMLAGLFTLLVLVIVCTPSRKG